MSISSTTFKKGHRISEEIKRKIGLANKGKLKGNKHTLGKHWKLSKQSRENQSKARRGKLRPWQKGKNNWNWKGGIGSIRRKIEESLQYKEWRQQVFIRDNFTCQQCGDSRGGDLEAHHKKSFSILLQEVKSNLPLFNIYEATMIYKPFWDINNGKTLCTKCHKRTNNYPKNFR